MATTIRIGSREVPRLGYGAMRIVGQPGNWGPPADREASLAVLRRAAELGVGLVDTADAYGPGVSEELVAEALRPYPDHLVVATKGGAVKTGPSDVHFDGSPSHLRAACEASLRRLGVERIDLYQLHWPDPNVPFEQSVAVLAELKAEGKIAEVGLCNVSTDQLRAAQAVTPVASVQNRYSLADRDDDDLVDLCAAEGVAFLPYGPLGAQPYERNAPLAAQAGGALAAVAARLGASPGQVALAWLYHRSPVLLPIPGTTSLDHLRENVAAASLELSADDRSALGAGG